MRIRIWGARSASVVAATAVLSLGDDDFVELEGVLGAAIDECVAQQ